MKTEANFRHGETVFFYNKEKTESFTGKIDYGFGDEEEGYIRVQQIFTETSDIGNTIYVPIDQIRDNLTASKIIPSMGKLRLYKDEVEGIWMLEEAIDIQSYDEYNDAKADYDKVDCVKTLTEVFGWDENPYER